MAIDLHWLLVGLIPLRLFILSIAYRRFLLETWLFFTFEPFAELLVDIEAWHVKNGVAFGRHDLNVLADTPPNSPPSRTSHTSLLLNRHEDYLC